MPFFIGHIAAGQRDDAGRILRADRQEYRKLHRECAVREGEIGFIKLAFCLAAVDLLFLQKRAARQLSGLFGEIAEHILLQDVQKLLLTQRPAFLRHGRAVVHLQNIREIEIFQDLIHARILLRLLCFQYSTIRKNEKRSGRILVKIHRFSAEELTARRFSRIMKKKEVENRDASAGSASCPFRKRHPAHAHAGA